MWISDRTESQSAALECGCFYRVRKSNGGEEAVRQTQTTGLMTPTGELEPQIAYTASEKGHLSCKGLVELAGCPLILSLLCSGVPATVKESLGLPKPLQSVLFCFVFYLQSEKPRGPQKAAMSQMCSWCEGTGSRQLGIRPCAGGHSQRTDGTTGTTVGKTASYCQKQVSVISMEGFTLCLSMGTLIGLSWAGQD